MTSLNDYQCAAMRTANKTSLEILALGLAGEAGEVADYLKKVLGHGHTYEESVLRSELGDVLWYIAMLAAKKNIDLEEVAQDNLAKLQQRYPNGFSQEDSIARKDVTG